MGVCWPPPCFCPRSTCLHAAEAVDSEALQANATLYVWLPSMAGTSSTTSANGSATVSGSDILNALNMAFMGALEFRKGKWSLLTDVVYLDLGADRTSSVGLPGGAINAGVDLDVSGWQLGVYGGYQLYATDKATLDILGGVRYLTLDTDASLSISGPLPPSLPDCRSSASTEVWDAVVGFRGRWSSAATGTCRTTPMSAPATPELTWQAMVGVGYRAGWGDLLFYRHLVRGRGRRQNFCGPGIHRPRHGRAFPVLTGCHWGVHSPCCSDSDASDVCIGPSAVRVRHVSDRSSRSAAGHRTVSLWVSVSVCTSVVASANSACSAAAS